MARSCKKDALEKFRFGITWDSPALDPTQANVGGIERTIIAAAPKAGFHDIQMPKRATNKIMYREGTDPDVSSISAGLSTMEDIVLNRGLAYSAAEFKEIQEWVSLVHSPSDTTDSLALGSDSKITKTGNLEYRKTVTIWMYDRSGNKVREWKLFNSFPVNFVPGSDLNAAEDGEKSLEQITLAYEDFMEVLPDTDTPVVGQ